MKKHTVSLKLAKRMKKLGWEKETLFWWNYDKDKEESELLDRKIWEFEYYPAPIASEILEELPLSLEKGNGIYYLEIERDEAGFVCHYVWELGDEDEGTKTIGFGRNDELAEALGKCWCYLVENDIIKTNEADKKI